MNKQMILLAAAAALLAGCKSEVMNDRKYVAGPEGTLPEAMPATAPATQTPGPTMAPAPAPAPVPAAPKTYAPMTFTPKTPKKTVGISAEGGSYTVQSGDTMGKIAAANGVKLSALLQANGMDMKSASKIRVGQKIVIPGAKGVVKPAKAAKTAKVGAATVAPDADGTYTVKSGDTPERIARKLGVKVSALMEANNLTEASARRLKIGQKLAVPGKAAAPAATAQASAPVEAAPAEAPVAAAAATAPAEAAAPVPAPTAAPAAEAVPAVQTGNSEFLELTEDTTLEALAQKYGITVEELCKMNTELKPGTALKKGDVVFIPSK